MRAEAQRIATEKNSQESGVGRIVACAPRSFRIGREVDFVDHQQLIRNKNLNSFSPEQVFNDSGRLFHNIPIDAHLKIRSKTISFVKIFSIIFQTID